MHLRIAASCSGAMPASTLPGRLGCVAPGAAGWLPDAGWLAAGAEGTYWRAGSWAGCVDAISFGMVIGYRTVSSRSRACADCVGPPGISAHKSFQTSYIAFVVSDSEEDPLLVGGRGGLEGTIPGRVDHGGGKRGHVLVTRAYIYSAREKRHKHNKSRPNTTIACARAIHGPLIRTRRRQWPRRCSRRASCLSRRNSRL